METPGNKATHPAGMDEKETFVEVAASVITGFSSSVERYKRLFALMEEPLADKIAKLVKENNLKEADRLINEFEMNYNRKLAEQTKEPTTHTQDSDASAEHVHKKRWQMFPEGDPDPKKTNNAIHSPSSERHQLKKEP
jgi:hypothetical protein